MDHRNAGFRHFAGTIVTVALTLGGLAVAGPSQAADHEKRKSERIVIVTHEDDGDSADGERRRIRIRDGKSEDRRVRIVGPEGMRDCGGAADAIDESSDDGSQRTRIMVCSRGGEASTAERIERLEKVRTRIGSDDELSDEHKARVTAALDAAIARLRRSE